MLDKKETKHTAELNVELGGKKRKKKGAAFFGFEQLHLYRGEHVALIHIYSGSTLCFQVYTMTSQLIFGDVKNRN